VSVAGGGPIAHLATAAGLSLGGVQKLAAKTLTKIADGIDMFIHVAEKPARRVSIPAAVKAGGIRYSGEGKKKPEKVKASASGKERISKFKEDSEAIHRATASLPILRRDLHDKLQTLRSVDFPLADRIEAHAEARAKFLSDKLPRNPWDGRTLLGMKGWRPSELEMDRWERYAAAAEDPTRLSDELQAGRLSPETVETVKTLYPAIYAAVQAQLIARLPELQEKLSYPQRVNLSILFGVAADPSMEPSHVATMQASFAQEPEPPMASKAEIGSVKNQEQPTQAQKLSG